MMCLPVKLGWVRKKQPNMQLCFFFSAVTFMLLSLVDSRSKKKKNMLKPKQAYAAVPLLPFVIEVEATGHR